MHLGHWKPCVRRTQDLRRGESGWCIRELRPHTEPLPGCPNPFQGELQPLWSCFPTENPLFVKALFPKSDLLSQDTLQLMMSMETVEAAMHGLAPGCWPGRELCLGHCSLEWSQAGKHMPSPESQGWRSLCRCLPQLPSCMERGQLAHRLLS